MPCIQSIQARMRKVNPFQGLLLLWIGFVYLWGVLWGGEISEPIIPHVFFLFTLLMLLHFSLYGISSFRSAPSHWFRFSYFVIQTLLIILISLVAHRFTVTLFLYLALVGEIASSILKIRMALLVGAACLFLFALTLHLLYGWESVPILPQHPVPSYLAPFYVLPAFVLVVIYALRQTRARVQTQRLLWELEQAHRQLADDAIRIEELTRGAERRRMARELHDTLAQGLTGLILQLEAVKAHLVTGRDERALEIVIQTMGRARITLADARSAIDDLRTETMTPADLQHALEEETLRFTAATGIPCSTQFSSLSLVPEAFSESIMRSVTEGVLNIARHAQASQVWVCVAQHDQELEILVRDNGRGFDPKALAQQGHYGLLGLRERTRLLGGQFTVISATGKGTTLRFLLPIIRGGDRR